MNRWIESLYGHSPVLMQNIMTSLYGWHLHKLRFGGVHRAFLRQIEKTQWWSRVELRKYQDAQIRDLIRFAARSNSFYRRRFLEYGLNPEQVRTCADLRRLPVLRKPEIRGRAEEMLSDGLDPARLFRGNTSGTTGTAMYFFRNREEVQKTWAFLERFRHWAGVSSRHRRASFGVRVIVPEGELKPPYSRYNFSERQRLFSIYTISPHTVSDYYRELQKFRPDYFEGYPSAMYLVARFMKEKNLQGIRPRAIISFAETLLAEQRRMLEEQFGCRVFDWYGTSEGSVHIMQCDQGTYHVCAEFGYVEVLDSRGNPVPAGESGEIVGTSFVNRCHPLIRFETGDIGVASDRVCPCGRGLPAFESIIGRKDDVIITADGRHLSRLDGVFKNTYHIREAQIVQEDLQSVQVFVVTDPGFEDFDRKTLLENLRHYIGDQMTFRISPVRAIDRTAAGKFRSVISKLPPRDVAESKKSNQ